MRAQYSSLLLGVVAGITGLVGASCCTPAFAQAVQDVTEVPASDVVKLDLGDYTRPDAHGPIGLMGEHAHNQGEWMLSYRYMYMRMRGTQDGNHKATRNDVLSNYMVAPTDMNMHMHMIGGMYAPHDRITLTAMLPVIQMTMDHENRMGAKFTTSSAGIGDLKTNVLVPIVKKNHHQLITKMGVSWPTGSIDQKDTTPAGKQRQLPYPMQLGSGTYDLLPGITYTGYTDHFSFGVQSGATIRTGRNSRDYRLGNRVYITPWVATKINKYLSTSVRLDGQAWGNITGRDNDLNPAMVPTANTNLQRGRRLDLKFGVNLLAPQKSILKNQRLAVEVGFPVYQKLNGPQLKTSFLLTAGWQWAL